MLSIENGCTRDVAHAREVCVETDAIYNGKIYCDELYIEEYPDVSQLFANSSVLRCVHLHTDDPAVDICLDKGNKCNIKEIQTSIRDLTIKNMPRLEHIKFSGHAILAVKNCPRLAQITGTSFGSISIIGSGQITIRCTNIYDLESDCPIHLSLCGDDPSVPRKFPAVTHLTYNSGSNSPSADLGVDALNVKHLTINAMGPVLDMSRFDLSLVEHLELLSGCKSYKFGDMPSLKSWKSGWLRQFPMPACPKLEKLEIVVTLSEPFEKVIMDVISNIELYPHEMDIKIIIANPNRKVEYNLASLIKVRDTLYGDTKTNTKRAIS